MSLTHLKRSNNMNVVFATMSAMPAVGNVKASAVDRGGGVQECK
ncbi:hypothetical protein [Corynebacterium freiburgense]|nr:hypothetical protein [Corynebacterium freiburgense]